MLDIIINLSSFTFMLGISNPKFLEATDVEEKKQENEEKARLNNIGKEVTIKDEEVVEEENKDKENKQIEKTEE